MGTVHVFEEFRAGWLPRGKSVLSKQSFTAGCRYIFVVNAVLPVGVRELAREKDHL